MGCRRGDARAPCQVPPRGRPRRVAYRRIAALSPATGDRVVTVGACKATPPVSSPTQGVGRSALTTAHWTVVRARLIPENARLESKPVGRGDASSTRGGWVFAMPPKASPRRKGARAFLSKSSRPGSLSPRREPQAWIDRIASPGRRRSIHAPSVRGSGLHTPPLPPGPLHPSRVVLEDRRTAEVLLLISWESPCRRKVNGIPHHRSVGGGRTQRVRGKPMALRQDLSVWGVAWTVGERVGAGGLKARTEPLSVTCA